MAGFLSGFVFFISSKSSILACLEHGLTHATYCMGDHTNACDSSLKTQIMNLTLSHPIAAGSPSRPISDSAMVTDLQSIDSDSPLFFNLMHDRPFDMTDVPLIGEHFKERRLAAIKWTMGLNMWTSYNLAAIPLLSIYPAVPLTGSLQQWSAVPNPTVVDQSTRTFMLAVRILDKFFIAGASASSRQRSLNFNVWKDKPFTPDEDDALLIYTACCFVLACKMEMSESAPRMVEIYQLMENWKGGGSHFKGLPSFADLMSTAKTSEKTGSVVIAQLYVAEVLVLQDCEWGLGMITPMHVLDEVQKETCDDPNFLLVWSLSISNAIRLSMDTRYVYNAACSQTRLALCAMAEAQLVVDNATPPTQRRINKKRRSSSEAPGLFDNKQGGDTIIPPAAATPSVAALACPIKQTPQSASDTTMSGGGCGGMDPGLRDVVGCFLKKQRILRLEGGGMDPVLSCKVLRFLS